MVPTYAFVGCLLAAIVIGCVKTFVSGGRPLPVTALPPPHFVGHAPSLWLLLHAFAAGCTAMTGVEAVSNGVKAFREPAVVNARRTLTIVIVTLIVLLGGISYLVRAYGIAATEPGKPGYDSVLSMLLAAVAGKGVFYFVAIGSILLVLALSANTAFADFPRLCRVIAQDGYLPHSFAVRGRRLVYSNGIHVLVVLSAAILILFRGVTDRLIPLFAVGAFLAFTLSQVGMVGHWKRVGGPTAGRSMAINGLGALATGIATLVILVAKFMEGAWVTIILIPVLLVGMAAIRRYYHRVATEIRCTTPLELDDLSHPIVIVPIQKWSETTRKALSFAFKISPEIRAVHVESDEATITLRKEWAQLVEGPTGEVGLPRPELIVLQSPYRAVVHPILDYVLEVERSLPNRQIAVVIPELVQRHWYHYLLHNKRAALLKALLLVRGTQQTIVINVPWYLSPRETSAGAPKEGG